MRAHFLPFMLAGLVLVASCTKRNPDLCCETDAECKAIDFSSHAPCDIGVCVANTCSTDPGVCDGDEDCSGATPFCVGGTCAACATSTTCPTTAPACDMTSHECRLCQHDEECSSGACDLTADATAGTCIDPMNILYAGPNGTALDPCSAVQPCSLHQAATLVDANHPYIVLLPGNHTSGAAFNDQPVTVAGNGATISVVNDVDSELFLGLGPITIRDVEIDEHLQSTSPDAIGVIVLSRTKLVIDNLQSSTLNLPALLGEGNSDVTMTRSTISGVSLYLSDDDNLTADQCQFNSSGINTSGRLQLSNSIIVVTDPTQFAISVGKPSQGTSQGVTANNNTIVGGKIDCSTVDGSFNSNILYNTSAIIPGNESDFIYNLLQPNIDLGIQGSNNITGDPKFVDAAHNDFHLQAGSPAIDAANPDLVTAPHDFDGTPRPQGARYDIGAFEYVPPAAN